MRPVSRMFAVLFGLWGDGVAVCHAVWSELVAGGALGYAGKAMLAEYGLWVWLS